MCGTQVADVHLGSVAHVHATSVLSSYTHSKRRSHCGGLAHNLSCFWLCMVSGSTWTLSGTSMVCVSVLPPSLPLWPGRSVYPPLLLPPPSGLGWKEDMSLESLEGASLLHWSGKSGSPYTQHTLTFTCTACPLSTTLPRSPSGKPWLPDGLYRELWRQHLPPACSDHGRCVRVQGGGYRCQCAEGYSGQTCQETAR